MGKFLSHLMNEARYFAEKNKMEDLISTTDQSGGAKAAASGALEAAYQQGWKDALELCAKACEEKMAHAVRHEVGAPRVVTPGATYYKECAAAIRALLRQVDGTAQETSTVAPTVAPKE